MPPHLETQGATLLGDPLGAKCRPLCHTRRVGGFPLNMGPKEVSLFPKAPGRKTPQIKVPHKGEKRPRLEKTREWFPKRRCLSRGTRGKYTIEGGLTMVFPRKKERRCLQKNKRGKGVYEPPDFYTHKIVCSQPPCLCPPSTPNVCLLKPFLPHPEWSPYQEECAGLHQGEALQKRGPKKKLNQGVKPQALLAHLIGKEFPQKTFPASKEEEWNLIIRTLFLN